MAFGIARPYGAKGRAGGSNALWLSAILFAAAILASTGACGTNADGVDSCKQIEETRCKRAPSCAIALEPPYSTSGGDVAACIRFYDVACLHGLEVGDPGPTAVHACVVAIENDGCGIVSAPQTNSACAWLQPTPSASTDASYNTSAADAAAD